MYKIIRILFVFIFSLTCIAEECTVGVFSGRITLDHRPLLWKNRDSNHRNNSVYYFQGKKYPFIGVINRGDTTQVWMGINSAGFAIMNSESKDLPGDKYDAEGILMKTVLGICATVDDFAGFLDSTNRAGRAVTSNFGVIDANGDGGIFETGNHQYTFFDVNDTASTHSGFLIRANFAETGNGKGYGKERYQRAADLVNEGIASGKFGVRYLIHIVAKDISSKTVSEISTACDSLNTHNCINRYRTVSSAVFQGVNPSEPPAASVMWYCPGEPVAGIYVPLWVGGFPEGLNTKANQLDSLNYLIQMVKNNLYPWKNSERCISIPKVQSLLPLTGDIERLNLTISENYRKIWLINSYQGNCSQQMVEIQKMTQTSAKNALKFVLKDELYLNANSR